MGLALLPRFLFAYVAMVLAAGMGGIPAAAQSETGAAAPSPPATAPSAAGASAAEQVAHFVTSVMPTANFVSAASRLAVSRASSGKIRQIAEMLAKDQPAVTRSLSAWVNVTGPVITRNPRLAGVSGPAARISAPNFLPSQADTLQRLSASQGKKFDLLFVSSQMEALSQLQTLYRDFIQNGADPGLVAIAARELPKVEEAISAVDAANPDGSPKVKPSR